MDCGWIWFIAFGCDHLVSPIFFSRIFRNDRRVHKCRHHVSLTLNRFADRRAPWCRHARAQKTNLAKAWLRRSKSFGEGPRATALTGIGIRRMLFATTRAYFTMSKKYWNGKFQGCRERGMTFHRHSSAGLYAIAVASFAIASGPLAAQQKAAPSVGSDAIGGQVTGPNGPEAGVWV